MSDQKSGENGRLAFPRQNGRRPLSDADFRLMVESVSDYAILMLDTSGFVRTWNAGARRIKGYEADEIVGRHFSLFYPQESIDKHWPEHELKVALETGRFEDQGWRLRKDGTRFWANVVITKLVDADGEFRGYAKITRDLTERRAQEEILRQSEERFRLMVEGVKDYAIFMLDPSGYIISWNTGAQLNKGYTAAEAIGKHFSIFYPENVVASGWPEHELRLALKDGRFEDEGWRVRKDGSRFWANVVITPLHDTAGRHRGFAKVTRDLTDKRKVVALEDERRRINTFLAMLGHELRNPLAPISNAMALMGMEEIASEKIRLARDVVTRQVKHMTRLVDDLLDVSRITTGKIHLESKAVNVREAVLEASEAVEPLMEQKRHRLRLEVESADVWVRGDPARLVQVVTNLLHNAAKFTPEEGEIVARIRLGDGNVEICIKDNGPGIPPEILPDIFDLFVQGPQDLARSVGGLGLGLSLVKQLVALHGGRVAARSSGIAGKGAEFWVTLPTIPPPVQLASAENGVQATASRGRVLVVDDNRDAATTMAMVLQGLGYRTTVVHDGPAAIAAVKAHAPDLVLLDIGLPGMSGLEVATRIAAEIVNPPPLVAVTGYGQDKDREDTFKAGFFAHLAKPLDVKELTELMNALLRK